MQKPKFWLPLGKLLLPIGRISRLQYFVYGLICILVFVAISIALTTGSLFKVDGEGNLADQSAVGIASYCVVQLAMTWCLFVLDVKRLHDLNWPGVLVVLVLVDMPTDLVLDIARNFTTLPPVVHTVQTVIGWIGKIGTFGVGLSLTFGPGNKGPNKYGPDPLKPPAPPIEVF